MLGEVRPSTSQEMIKSTPTLRLCIIMQSEVVPDCAKNHVLHTKSKVWWYDWRNSTLISKLFDSNGHTSIHMGSMSCKHAMDPYYKLQCFESHAFVNTTNMLHPNWMLLNALWTEPKQSNNFSMLPMLQDSSTEMAAIAIKQTDQWKASLCQENKEFNSN